MTAIRPAEIDTFIATGSRDTAIFLVFGPDEGLVRDRVRRITQSSLGAAFDPMSLVEFDAEQLKQDPARLLDEAHSISMFGGRRAIVVRQAGKVDKAAWQPIFDTPPTDSLVVFQADDLQKSAPLRRAAEASKSAAAIICYSPGPAEIRQAIDTACSNAGIKITPVARSSLAELLGADYALSQSELEKLLLYCTGRLSIDIQDIEAIVTNSAASAGFEPVDCAFDGKLEEVESFAVRSFREGINPAGLLNLALNHAFLLRRLATANEAGRVGMALEQERIFFRRQDRVRQQARTWSHPMLARAVEALTQAMDQSRRFAALEETIAVRALWSVALGARRR